MHSHPLSLPRMLARRQHENTEPVPLEPSFFRGYYFALAFSIPIWGLIIWGVFELFH